MAEVERDSADGPWPPAVEKGVLRCTNTSQKLESAIFNAVSLGQWETAQAHFATLARWEGGRCREDAKELLKLLIMEASNFWSESIAIPSPHHLSWLALQAYRSLFPDADDQLPAYVEQLIQFRLLLCSTQSVSSSSSIFSTLCRYHATHVLAIPGASPEPVPQLQPHVLSFLYDILVSSPALGHALIRNLTVSNNPAYLSNNEALQLLYVEAINECLEALSQLKLPEGVETTDSDSQYESDHTSTSAAHGPKSVTKECYRLTNLIYDLLSLMDAQPDMPRVSVDKLFVCLLELHHQIGPEVTVQFEPGKIYSCLLGRSSPYLLERLHDAEEYVRVRAMAGSVGGEEKAGVTGRQSLELLKRTGSPQDWRGLFYYVHHDHKHFLESVLEMGLQLICAGQLDKLSQLMSCPEYGPLRPVLLLLGWDKYLAEGSGKELMEALWPSQVSQSQPLLYDGCCRLAFQVELVQWCLEKARPHLHSAHLTSSSHSSTPHHLHHHRAGDMFKGLETHSVLYILHHYTPLAALDSLEVVEILKLRPRVPSLSISLTPPPQFSRGTTPLKPVDSDSSPKHTPLSTPQKHPSHQPGVLKPEQERDIAIFRGFCALKLVMDAIWAAVHIANGLYPMSVGGMEGGRGKEGEGEGGEEGDGKKEKEGEGRGGEEGGRTEEEEKGGGGGEGEGEPSRGEEEGAEGRGATKDTAQAEKKRPFRTARKLHFGEGDKGTADAGDLDELTVGERAEGGVLDLSPTMQDQVYSRLVLDKLREAKVYISLLYPLNYRLEILENIFSLLFLTSEDIRALRQVEGEKLPPVKFHVRSSSPQVEEIVTQPSPAFQSDSEFSSSLSAISLIRSMHGFLNNEKVTGDLLNFLQDSMFELRAARFVLTQPQEVGAMTTLPPEGIRSSISQSSLQQRSAKLEQYINEARWRLQLVSSKHGIVASQHDGQGLKEKWLGTSSSGESMSEVSGSDSEMEEREKKKPSRKSASAESQEPKPESQPPQITAEAEVNLLPTSSKPPSIMSKATYTGKVSPNLMHVSSAGNIAGSAKTSSQFTRSLTMPSVSSSRGSLSPKLQNRRSLRQKSPRASVEGRSGSSSSSNRPTSSSSPLPNHLDQLREEADSGDFADVDSPGEWDPGRRKKRLRSRSLQAAKKRRKNASERAEYGIVHGSVISQMLASPGSLLRMCLKHSNYSRAYEVLKMFGMEGQFGEAFVNFSEKFELVSRDLAEHSRGSTPKHSPSLTPQDSSSLLKTTPPKVLSSSLSASTSQPGLPRVSTAGLNTHLQVVIANATNSSSTLESLHHLLAPSSIHRMLFSGDEQLERAAQDSALLQGLVEHVPALVMLDVVCSSQLGGQISKRIIELATCRCQAALESFHTQVRSATRKPSSGKRWSHHDVSLPGPLSFLLLLSEVSGYFTTPTLSPSLQGTLTSPPFHSPHSLLSAFSRQLRTASIMNYKAFLDSYHGCREKLDTLLEEEPGVKGDIVAALVTPGLGLGESSRSVSLSHPRRVLGGIFEELIRVLSRNPRAPSLPGSPREGHLGKRQSVASVSLSPSEGTVDTAFLLQFSRYLTRLMDLLLKCLAPGPTSLSEGSLLLSILQESPSKLLGRLVFDLGIQPNRLEQLMVDFPHIHMMEVLVRCCCPPIPSKTATISARALPPPTAVVVLNEGDSPGSLSDPCAFSEKLLSKLVSVLKDYLMPAGAQEGTLSPEDLVQIYHSAEMKKLISKTPLLASVDLRTLESSTKQMVFYSNIVNFLYAHCIMVCLASEQEGGELGLLREGKISLSALQRSSVLQACLFSRLGYRIGQLGVVSCHDLHYSILRRGLSTPHLSRDTDLWSRIAPVKPDPWAVYAPSSADPRLLYVVHSGRVSSPLPTVLSPDDLSSTLRIAEKQYLTSCVQIDVTTKEVVVPQWLFTHRDDFGKPIWNDKHSHTSYHHLSHLSLLTYLQSKMGREQAEILQPMVVMCESHMSRKLPLPVKVSMKKDSLEFGYNFISFRHRVASGGGGVLSGSGKLSPRSSPKVLRKRLSKLRGSQAELPETSPAPQPVLGYSFTSELLSFVSRQNSLLAAIIHLLSPPPTPSLTSLSATGSGRKTGKTGRTGSEEDSTVGSGDMYDGEREREKEKEKEQRREKEEGGRKTLFGLKGRGKPPLTRRTSYDDKTPLMPVLSAWQRELEDILVQFVTLSPMQHFLQARLSPFRSVLLWDPLPGKQGSRDSSYFDAGVSLRGLSLLPSRGEQMGRACSYAMHKLIETGQAQEAVRFLTGEPAACHRRRLHFLKDLAISSAFVENYSEVLALGHSGEAARETLPPSFTLALLSQLSDPEMAARLSLSSLHNWPVDLCVDILSYCCHHLPPGSTLLPTLREKLERMAVYASIMEKCKSPLSSKRGGGRLSRSSWQSWSALAGDSEKRPEYVRDVLLTSRAFDLARKWAKVHNLEQSVTQQIEVDYLFALLEGNSPDPMAAHQVLDTLMGDQLRLHVCESVLSQCTNLETTIFILHYMLSKLGWCLHDNKRQDYCNGLLGAQALLCLPAEERQEYKLLKNHAALLVEQLLINKKTDLAAKVVKQLRSDEHIDQLSVKDDTPQLDHIPMALSEDETQDPFTTIFMFYAGKTLEFPPPVIVASTPQPFSTATTAFSTRPASPGGLGLLSPGEPHNISTEAPSRMSYSHKRRCSSTTQISPTPLNYGDSTPLYEPPLLPPPKDKWEPDAKAMRCRVCNNVYFGMFNRRHHCRRCGRVVCTRCSPYFEPVDGYDRPVRTCRNCHAYAQAHNVDSSNYSEFSPYLSSAFPAFSPSPSVQWRLLPNDSAYNLNIRKNFYYEESPNSALCLTIVDLISSRSVAAAFLLDCCHSVSLQLVPDTQGRVNQEVDHYFVIGLIQHLLWNAKLRYADASDSSGVELCDTYLSRVDLLRQLVSSRCRIIPSIQELTKPELARRVRDRLILEDQFELAMEVSTKCQLDTVAVWSAWGLGCLRCGDYSKARDKFKHCFQVTSHRGAGLGPANLQLLERIVEQIEQTPLAVTGRNTQHAEDWSSVMVGCMALYDRRSEDCDLDIHRFGECLHYIQSYGGSTSAVGFFVRHNCWTDACKFILDKKCHVDVFVEQLWVPALKAGVIENVQEILKALDHSLGHWEPYLTAVCRYFTQRSLYHILYQTQLFMRDFIRAGMTCIKFFIGFSGRNTTIRDLFSRLHYLNTAARHFQSALDAKQRASERVPGRGRGHQRGSEDYHALAASTKSMSVADLQSHMSTISLQMKVTEFLYDCAEAAGTLRSPLVTSGEVGGINNSGGVTRKPPQPITLFSSGHTRAEVAVQLLLASQDIVEGFDIAREIIQTYRLPPSHVLSEASRGLATAQRYDDVRLLLQQMRKSLFASDSLNDEILMAAIKVLASQTRETKQVEKLVQLLASEKSKIKALVQCGKLKNAYLIAIKSRQIEEVRNISEIAEKAGQLAVRDICEKWLQTNAGFRVRHQ